MRRGLVKRNHGCTVENAGGKTKGGAFARLSAGRRSALSPPRATRTTEKVRSGHRFSSGDTRTPCSTLTLWRARRYEAREVARGRAEQGAKQGAQRVRGLAARPGGRRSQLLARPGSLVGGSWAWAGSADGSGGRAVAKATIHPPNRPVLREPRARALLLPLGIFAMPAAHAAHICGDNVGAPERLEHPEQLFAHKWQCQRLDSSSEEGKDARL